MYGLFYRPVWLDNHTSIDKKKRRCYHIPATNADRSGQWPWWRHHAWTPARRPPAEWSRTALAPASEIEHISRSFNCVHNNQSTGHFAVLFIWCAFRQSVAFVLWNSTRVDLTWFWTFRVTKFTSRFYFSVSNVNITSTF